MRTENKSDGLDVRSRPCICLVDDDESMLSLFSHIVKRSGCDVVTAKGPEAAEKLLVSTQVDIVISDHRMPDASDGEKLLRSLVECYPQLAIVIMSCDFSSEVRTKLLEAGAVDCVIKPLTVTGISGLVDTLGRGDSEHRQEMG